MTLLPTLEQLERELTYPVRQYWFAGGMYWSPLRLDPVALEEDACSGRYFANDLLRKCLRDNGRMAWESTAREFLAVALVELATDLITDTDDAYVETCDPERLSP